MASLPFIEKLETASHLTILSRRFFDVWWLYEGEDTRPAILDELNGFPEFFRFDSHAHFVAMITHLHSLYETRQDTINFKSLISEASRNAWITDMAIQDTQAHLDATADIQKKVVILRNNLFGHRSAALSYNRVFELARITPSNIRELADVGFLICNALLRDLGLQECIYFSGTKEHLCGLLDLLNKSSRGGQSPTSAKTG